MRSHSAKARRHSTAGAVLVSAMLVATGCAGPAASGGPTPVVAPTSLGGLTPTGPPPTATVCPSATAGRALSEQEGSASGATLWALFFTDPNDIRHGEEIKIAWRMTGAGDFAMTATGPGGAAVSPAWGPEGHGGSTWVRPGEEWGTGWVFPTAGCWTMRATRTGGAVGVLTVRVR